MRRLAPGAACGGGRVGPQRAGMEEKEMSNPMMATVKLMPAAMKVAVGISRRQKQIKTGDEAADDLAPAVLPHHRSKPSQMMRRAAVTCFHPAA